MIPPVYQVPLADAYPQLHPDQQRLVRKMLFEEFKLFVFRHLKDLEAPEHVIQPFLLDGTDEQGIWNFLMQQAKATQLDMVFKLCVDYLRMEIDLREESGPEYLRDAELSVLAAFPEIKTAIANELQLSRTPHEVDAPPPDKPKRRRPK